MVYLQGRYSSRNFFIHMVVYGLNGVFQKSHNVEGTYHFTEYSWDHDMTDLEICK